MNTLANKMQNVLAEIEADRGGVALFALFEREDSLGKWDIVVAADWVRQGERSAREYVISKIQPKLTLAELVAVSRVIVLTPEEHFVRFIQNLVGPGGVPTKFVNCSFYGMEIAHAYVLRSDASLLSAVADPDLPAVADPEAMMAETQKILDEMHPNAAATTAPDAPRRGRRSRTQ